MLIQDAKVSNVTNAYGGAPGITFNRFICVCVVIKQLSGALQGLVFMISLRRLF
ncbi:hypothetical protein F4604DRAFT_1744440 [Suillus subluteus]|nr:hypothetical protein F4604DRAFT_1744440 [Suillus subluteus]